jgi:hypothetical protein
MSLLKGYMFFVVTAGLFAAACVAGEYRTLPVRGHDVALTNTQANSSWTVAGAMMHFTTPPVGTVVVSRVSGGVEFVLSSTTNVSSDLWWSADSEVTFNQGDALMFYTGGATGVVQVMRKAGE